MAGPSRPQSLAAKVRSASIALLASASRSRVRPRKSEVGFLSFAPVLFAQFGQDHGSLCGLIARYTEIQWVEAQQIAACNAAHDAAPRLCRWLLQSADRIGSDHLPLTQELIAEMLGVRRTTVTRLAQSLQRRDIIKYMRGHISILDRERLQHGACECYAVMQQEKLPLKIGVTF